MNRLIYKIVIFLIPFILGTLFFEVYLRKVNTHYKIKKNGLLANSKSVEILVFGNSHAFYDVNPCLLTKPSYNMAMPNQSLLFDFEILQKYINDLPNLKYVILSLDYHSLYFSSQGMRDNWVYYDYGIDKNIQFKNKISRFWFGYSPKIALSMLKEDVFRRYYSYINGVKTLDFYIEDGINITDSVCNGWLGYTKTNSDRLRTPFIDKRASMFNKKVENKQERKKNLKLLEGFIEFLSINNIKPIIITLPIHPELSKRMNSGTIDQDKSDVKTLLKKFNVTYFDFTDCIKDSALFYDSDHLNKKGALVLTNQLNDSINKLQ